MPVPILKYGEDLTRVLSRSQLNLDDINRVVKDIVGDVQARGDAALYEYTQKFDGVSLNKDNVMLTEADKQAAYAKVPAETLDAMRKAKANIIAYHKRQIRPDNVVTESGKTTGYLIKPVQRAGIYVPGGKAAYPSSVLMCALPAVVAGVDEIIMATPAGKYLNPLTVVAACECGIKRIYKIGGAQAIAAMAFGTESIPKVNVIAGPGNIYVALAKKEVYGNVGIDMIAGPSEILIIADSTADSRFIAADMLSQAEHDQLALSMLITTDAKLADKVNVELDRMLKKLPKTDIASQALSAYGAIVLVDSMDQAIELSNRVAPEHLELCVSDPEKYLPAIRNAGAIFMGHYSPEPLGDYFAGSNHVLPTSGTAQFSSALGVDNYIKRISVIKYDKESLREAAASIVNLAETEDLTAHANSIRVRFDKVT